MTPATKRTITVLHTTRGQNGAIATIPMPLPTWHLQTSVRLGRTGPQYDVVCDEDGSDMRVYPAYLPRHRPMRHCPRRTAILSAVTSALPMTRPAVGRRDPYRGLQPVYVITAHRDGRWSSYLDRLESSEDRQQ